MSAPACTPAELMVVNAARLLREGDVVLVGVGLPNLACNLARRLHAPGLVMVYEAGVIGAQPERLPLSIGDPCLAVGALSICSMYELFAHYLQRGLISVGFVGGAQIDRYGNLNATVIGDYRRPKVRLPGSGGSMEIAAWADRVYMMAPHRRRRFPARCDFITSAGFLDGRSSRRARRLRGGGPAAVVTDLALLEPDAQGELTLVALHPGVTIEQVQAQTGWPLQVAEDLRTTQPPTREELETLRALDPQGVYLG